MRWSSAWRMSDSMISSSVASRSLTLQVPGISFLSVHETTTDTFMSLLPQRSFPPTWSGLRK